MGQNTSNSESFQAGYGWGEAKFAEDPALTQREFRAKAAAEASYWKNGLPERVSKDGKRMLNPVLAKYPWLNLDQFVDGAVTSYNHLQQKAIEDYQQGR